MKLTNRRDGPIRMTLDSLPPGFSAPNRVRRHAIRAVVPVRGKLLLVRSGPEGDYAFPGGGREDGESPRETLAREVREETGYRLLSVGPLLFTAEETRPGKLNPDEILEMRSDYYLCEVYPEGGEQSLEDYEKDLGFVPEWVTPRAALRTNRAIARREGANVPAWLPRETRALALLAKSGLPDPLEGSDTLTILSDRLALEPLTPSRREDVFASFTAGVTRYMKPAPARDISETDAFIESVLRERERGESLVFAIVDRSNGSFVGCAGIHGLPDAVPELGVWIGEKRFGRGLGREAVHAAIRWGFDNLRAEGFRYPVDRRNLPSRKIAELAGGLPLREYRSVGDDGNDLDQIEYFIPRDGLAMPRAPELAAYGRWLEVPGKGRIFLYDTGAPAPVSGLSAQAATGNASKGSPGSDVDAPDGAPNLPPVVLVHGLGDEADSWRALLPLLAAKGFRVLAPDLPGFGRSTATGKVSMKTHAEAVRATLRLAAGGGSCGAILAGSSLGAAVCQLAAFAEPHAVSALAFLDGGLPTAERLDPRILAVFVPGLPERGYTAYRGDEERAYRSLAPYYANIDALPDADKAFLRARVTARVESDSQRTAYYSSFRDYVRLALTGRRRMGKGLASLAARGVRFLVLWGAEDRILSARGSSALRELLDVPVTGEAESRSPSGNARYLELDGVGHLPQQENPIAVAKALAELAGNTLPAIDE